MSKGSLAGPLPRGGVGTADEGWVGGEGGAGGLGGAGAHKVGGAKEQG